MKVVKSVKLRNGELEVESGEIDESPSAPMQWPRAFATSVNCICWTVLLIAFFYLGGCKLLH